MPETVQDLIRKEAEKAGLPAKLALAVAEQESGFNPTLVNPEAVGSEHAIGTFQFLPSTAKTLGIDPNDPRQNIQGGVKYLRQLMDKHQGNLDLVLKEYGGVRSNTTYVPGVLGRMSKFQTASPAAQPQAQAQVGTPPPAPPAAAPPQSFVDQALAGFDPMRPLGRRNLSGTIAGTVAGIVATRGLSTVPGMLAGAARIAAPIVGAAIGGGAAEAGEQAVGNAPPSPGNIAMAAGEQAAGEVVGSTLMWPLKAFGRRVAGAQVSQAVRETFSATMESASEAVRTLRTQARRALTQQSATSAATKAGIKAGTASQLAEIGGNLARQPGGPPPATVGRMANTVIQGPAKSVLEQTGQAVEEAAKSGPMVSLAPVRAKLEQIAQEILPPGGSAAPDTAYISDASRALMSPQDLAMLRQVEDTHPIKGILGQLQGLGDEIPFAEAHRIKRLLDETVNWESPAKKLVQQATKGIRQTLREAMTGHAPYDEATKAYADLVPLFRKGLAPRLKKQITENPEALINSIKPTKPTEVQLVKDLLLTQAAKGGGEAEGKAAWDSVRSAWTAKNVIDGPAEKLGDRMGKLTEEFKAVFYDDETGKQVYGNLQQIASAYDQAVQSGKMALSSQGLDSTLERASIQETAESAMAPYTQTMRDTRGLATEFKKSSLGKIHNMEGILTDAVRAAMLAPTSAWQNVAAFRLLFHGPKTPDLIRWAAYSSPATTQAFVKVLTSPLPGTALAALIKAPGFIDLLQEGESAAVSSPPPRAQGPGPTRGVGGAPPSPR